MLFVENIALGSVGEVIVVRELLVITSFVFTTAIYSLHIQNKPWTLIDTTKLDICVLLTIMNLGYVFYDSKVAF